MNTRKNVWTTGSKSTREEEELNGNGIEEPHVLDLALLSKLREFICNARA